MCLAWAWWGLPLISMNILMTGCFQAKTRNKKDLLKMVGSWHDLWASNSQNWCGGFKNGFFSFMEQSLRWVKSWLKNELWLIKNPAMVNGKWISRKGTPRFLRGKWGWPWRCSHAMCALGRLFQLACPGQDYMFYSFCASSLLLPNALVFGGHSAMLLIGTETGSGIF